MLLFERLVGGSTLPRSTLFDYDQFLKNCQTKTKPLVRGFIYWLECMCTMSDEKIELLLHCYTNTKT